VESATRTAVRVALDDLKGYLAVFVADARGNGPIPAGVPSSGRSSRRGSVAVHDADIAALVGVVLDEWHVFSSRLSPLVRIYLREVKEVRNLWAHERPFSEEEATRAVATIRLVGVAIGRPTATAGATKVPIDVVATNDEPSSVLRQPQVPTPTAIGRTGRSGAAVQRDSRGVVTNAAELTAADLAMERVLCPACGVKVFEKWPGGWDAHAASSRACRADLGATEAERKAEFKRRFREQFR
jgi:hypothetical protein